MAATHLLYIHGFNSSPASAKAELLRRYFADHAMSERLVVPALPNEPARAIELLEAEIAARPGMALAGSSLGGFYATWLAERHGLRAVLVNPAVVPWKLLDKCTGVQHNYHSGAAWELPPAWVTSLRRFAVERPARPENLLLLTQTGDETLDWREGWELYRDCHLYRGLGGNHGFADFDAFIPLLLRFLGIHH